MFGKSLNELKELYYRKEYLRFSIYTTIILLISFTITIVIYYIGAMAIEFIAEKFEGLVVIIGAYIMLYLFWKDSKEKRINEQQEALTNMQAVQDSAEKALYENNYSIARQCLFSLLCECADTINLLKPQRLSELDAPSKIIPKAGVYMTQFVALKKSECNPEEIREILNLKIGQKLLSFEFPGITQTSFIFNGNAYPILIVDEVKDQGTYLQIDLVWTNEKYCNLLNARAQAKLQLLQSQNFNYRDRDF